VVATDNVLYEFTIQGQLVQSFGIPLSPGNAKEARDVAVNGAGHVAVFNGTFAPRISVLNAAAGTWDQISLPGWSTVANATYGGIAYSGSLLFVTDMATASDNKSGVIRYDPHSGPVQSPELWQPIDLNLGLDGRLYVLSGSGSPSGTKLLVLDPLTLGTIDERNFGHVEHRSVAANSDGDVFLAGWNGDVKHINGESQSITNLCRYVDNINRCALYDIDVNAKGQLAVGSRWGDVFVLNDDLALVSSFRVGARGVFVAFVVPEPSSLMLAIALLSSLVSVGQAKRREASPTRLTSPAPP
jgi:hypothetical protein